MVKKKKQTNWRTNGVEKGRHVGKMYPALMGRNRAERIDYMGNGRETQN